MGEEPALFDDKVSIPQGGDGDFANFFSVHVTDGCADRKLSLWLKPLLPLESRHSGLLQHFSVYNDKEARQA